MLDSTLHLSRSILRKCWSGREGAENTQVRLIYTNVILAVIPALSLNDTKCLSKNHFSINKFT